MQDVSETLQEGARLLLEEEGNHSHWETNESSEKIGD